ncbi:MAG: peptidoglycan DD-metalloendopeptidase family protein [Pseudomonadota bacterium]
MAAVAAKPEEAASPGRERPESGPLSFGEPVDFGSLKGTLRWPVRGKLRRSVRDAPLRFRKAGIWLVGASNAPVRAVAAGRVAFADEFRGLGQLIILDHGDGFLSLYAETAELLKREGDFVETGEAIGSLGAASAGTPRLYFEIRHKGTAQDPLKWCAPHRG